MKVKEESEQVGLEVNIQKTKIMVSGSITSGKIRKTIETVERHYLFIYLFFSGGQGASKSLQIVSAATKLKDACSFEENYDPSRHHAKNQRHHFISKCLSSQTSGFSISHGCDNWTMKLRTEDLMLLNCIVFTSLYVFEKTLEIPLDCKKIQPVNPKGIFIGRTDSEG